MSGLADSVVTQDAQVVDVYNVRRGGVLAAALAPGSATLTVDDADQFVGVSGWLSVAAQDETFVPANPTDGTTAYYDLAGSAPVRYTKVDRDAGVITLAVPWDAAFPSFVAGDSVWVEPPSLDHRVDVALDGELGQTVTATVPHTLSAMLPDGTRESRGGEWVRVAVTDSGYELIDVLGEPAFVDAAAVVPDEDTGDDAAFDVITADQVISDSVPVRNGDDFVLYVDPLSGSDDNGGEALTPLLDGFDGTDASLLSAHVADSGHTWSQLQNTSATAIDLQSSAVRMRTSAASQNQVMRSTLGGLDFETLHSWKFNGPALPLASGQWMESGVALRIQDSSNLYLLGLVLFGTGTLRVQIDAKVGGSYQAPSSGAANLDVATGLTLAAVQAQTWWVRAQCQTNPDGGTDLRAKAWLDGSAEPDDWMLVANDTVGALQAPGAVGLAARNSAAITNASDTRLASLAASVISEDGVPVDVSVGGVGPLATVAAALAKVGDWNDGNVRIILSGVVEEDVDIRGLCGGGSLTIDGANAATLNGFIRVLGLAHLLTLTQLTVQDTGSPGPVATIEVRAGSSYVLVSAVNVQTNGYRVNVCQFSEGSRGRVDNTGLHNATSRGLYVVNASHVYASNNSGSTSPTSYQASCAVLHVDGSKPSNATNTTLGGQIFGTTSSNSGGSAPPPQPTKKTDTMTANATQTWRPSWAWDNDKQPKQGEWQGSGGLSRGCAFYGTKLRKSGRTAVSGKVYIKRAGSGGMSGKQDIFLACHNLEKQPSNDSSPPITLGPTRVGALGYGEGAWFTIPKSWVQSLMTGGARGLMLYHGSASPYVICQPAGGTNWKVSITHTP